MRQIVFSSVAAMIEGVLVTLNTRTRHDCIECLAHYMHMNTHTWYTCCAYHGH